MTDSMNFGPDWIRNLSSEGSTGGGTTGGAKYQLAEYRYGREEMLALFDKNSRPPASLTSFKCLYSEQPLMPLALLPTTEEERPWSTRPTTLTSHPGRGRGGSLERGGRISRGRGYQYGRGYDTDTADWSPRKEYATRTQSTENWRRARSGDQEDDGWRSVGGVGRSSMHEKWGRSTSWRGEGDSEDKTGPPERNVRPGWGDTNRPPPGRKSWDEDHLPEWATENPTDGGGSFDDKGAFHGSDDEHLDLKPPIKRELGLQKSTSQQHISTKTQPPPLSTSKSTMSLVKPEDTSKKEDQTKEFERDVPIEKQEEISIERKKSVPNIPERIDKPNLQERAKSEGPPKLVEAKMIISNGPIPDVLKNEDSDFERLQEDLVLKLMGDEEPPKPTPTSFDVGSIQPPPNLIPPVIQEWFYQDPQGQMQGPFSNIEMAEWYKAGYFSNQLKVRRQCDERFFLLGELIGLCGGVNPFTATVRYPTLQKDVTKMADPDILQYQYLSQMAAYKQAQARMLQEPWSALSMQQQELAAQRLILQQQPPVPQDLSFLQQSQTANPLMHMINQMQQANKLPGQGLVEKQPPTMPPALDPHLQLHMGNLLSMQNRLPTNTMTNNMPAGFTANLTGTLPPDSLSSSIPTLQAPMPLTGMQSGIPPVSLSGNITIPRPTSHGSVDQISGTTQSNDPISSLLKQLQQQKQQSPQMDSLWQQNQFSIPTPGTVPPAQWQSQNEIPMSMWDVTQNNTTIPAIPSSTIKDKLQSTAQAETPQQTQLKIQKMEKDIEKDKDTEKESKQKEEQSMNEKKKKKELEEKQAKKEAEEKRKAELKKIEAEKKATEERKRKEEERVKKELEKAKKEAEDKRLRELEEKRRLKELRKAEEETRKKVEEFRKQEEDRIRNELKEAEARRQAEERRIQQEQLRSAKAAPWAQSNSTLGLNLTDIQKAEREKRTQEALQLQRLQEKEFLQQQQQQQQQQQERIGGLQLNWAKKPLEPRKVKSLAEIQAEEQERLAKQNAETRLQKEKEKESIPVLNNTSSIWSSQNLTWASASTTNSQWSTNTGGFWEDSSNRQGTNKPSNVTKSNSTNSFNSISKQPAQKQTKPNKPKKEEGNKNINHNNNNNGPSSDDFTSWCYTSLSTMSTNIDIPTFVTFLRDIESAFDVREYCKEYLGDSNATHQFASNFLEKRRSFRPKNNAHKDDMCSPAPAITPSSLQHSTEFQEVKGKNKKNKKSKMLKVDSRILGFNVTSAPDRINVGDRDYGDNS